MCQTSQTVALEELNSEYIALKRGQGSKDDLSTALVSLRTRYNDIRAKVSNQSALISVKVKAVCCLSCVSTNGIHCMCIFVIVFVL